jgi:tetratricopeptide (TPR) repeat protein
METLKHTTVFLMLVVGIAAATAPAKSPSALLQEALYAEEVEGNLDTAIKTYQQVINDPSAQRSHIAQAIYRQGMCYLKLKKESQASQNFQKLISQFSDQTDIIKKVQPMLEDIINRDPAELMPPNTLVYVELGSPGKQIETILNLLKGTPFENPLTVIPGPRGHAGPGGASPDQIIASLLNPSMIAEFKKIRGLAVGVTGMRHDNPPMVAVLYPGKSDALRGIILALLGIVAKPGEPIEGMTSLVIEDSAGVVYDDNVIIFAQSLEQLNWCVKQHLGLTNNPTLASSNKSFAKISKKARNENLMTLWANVDEVYTRLLKQFPADLTPEQIFWANTIADFNSIDDLIAYTYINDVGLTSEANITFKDGHKCLVYDMIRTPNLSRAGLEAVPPEAIGLISFALGQPDGTQAKAVSEKLQNVTGLDIGREIFANIEQLTLFAVPSEQASGKGIPQLPASFGLAITSHNPQQTRQILTTILGTVNVVVADKQTGQTDAPAGRYQVGLVNGQQLYCYMDQANKTTVLSLNRDITDAAIAAVKQRKSVCNDGVLKDAVNRLSPTTSKLVLVNIGGAIRMAAPAIVSSFEGDTKDSLQQALSQLAQACGETYVEMLTEEQLNNFTSRVQIANLPPVSSIVGPVAEISGILGQAKAKAEAKRKRQERPVTIKKTSQAPVIDGKAENLWSNAKRYEIDNVIYSPATSDEDLSAYYKAMWDAENLYLLVDVIDDELKNDSVEFYYDDTVELFIDADNSKNSGYGENDYTYNFNWDRSSPSMEERGQPYELGEIKSALVTSANGYQLEVKLPWSTLGTKPAPGVKIGLDVHVNDDDDGGERDTKLTWRDKYDNAWQNPSVFGTVELAGLLGWWKLDESGGFIAADSSGNGHNGTLQGDPTWRPGDGKIGGALEFDGEDDYVEIEDETSFDITGQVTLSMWVKTNDTGNNENNPYVAKGDHSYAIKHYGDNSIEFFIYDGDWYAVQHSVDSSFNDSWHHLVGAYDGTQLRLYVDGLQQGTADHTGSIATSDFAVNIGRNSEHTDRLYDGLIDDVRIYNYALTEDEIVSLSKGK